MFNFKTKKMIKILNNVNIPSPGTFPRSAIPNKIREYLSPNGKFTAFVIPIQNSQSGKHESEIILKSETGKILFQKSYSFEDSGTSLYIKKAKWSADSRFFVYSMANSFSYRSRQYPTFFISTDKVARTGDAHYYDYRISDCCDHPPWHFPAFSFLTDDFEAKSLNDRIGVVVNPEFRLGAPDIIKIVAISKKIKEHYFFKVSLSDLAKQPI